MTRLGTFILGMVLGAGLTAALVFALWGAPRVHIAIEWPRAHAPQPEVSRDELSPLPAIRYAEDIEPVAATAPIPSEPPAIPAEPAESALATILPNEAETPPSPPLSLLIPVAGVSWIALYDTFSQARGTDRTHEALDIMAPRGTAVVAAVPGRVAKLFSSARGGLTVYQFDTSGRYALYYAHLETYAPGLVEGAELKRGDPIGTVGSSGNASPDGPHLHFAVHVLGPERRWWQGTAVNPYPLLERESQAQSE